MRCCGVSTFLVCRLGLLVHQVRGSTVETVTGEGESPVSEGLVGDGVGIPE